MMYLYWIYDLHLSSSLQMQKLLTHRFLQGNKKPAVLPVRFWAHPASLSQVLLYHESPIRIFNYEMVKLR